MRFSEISLFVAVHEAGHALACVRLGVEHEHATIVANEDAVGHVQLAGDCFGTDIRAEHRVVELCSGYAAVFAMFEEEEIACEGCRSDFEQAAQLIEAAGLTGGLDAWKARAVTLMQEPRNQAAVAQVAEFLNERKFLPCDYVEVLVEVADGDCTEEEFAKYVQEEDAKRASRSS